MPLINCENIYRTYQNGDIQLHALKDVSLQIDENKFVAITGKSGSGKSTLLNLIGGLDTPSNGKLFFDNENLHSYNKKQLARYRKNKVGFIFQSFNLINHFKAWENIALSLMLKGISLKERKNKAIELLSELGLEKRAEHYPREMSGGEMQRVSIARAIISDPSVILADEPTGNLDTENAAIIMNLLKNLQKDKGKTIVLVTHDIDYANTYSDEIIKLKDGEITEHEI